MFEQSAFYKNQVFEVNGDANNWYLQNVDFVKKRFTLKTSKGVQTVVHCSQIKSFDRLKHVR